MLVGAPAVTTAVNSNGNGIKVDSGMPLSAKSPSGPGLTAHGTPHFIRYLNDIVPIYIFRLHIFGLCKKNLQLFLRWIMLKYGSEEKGSSLYKCSILLGFILSKNLRGL